jgi:hypothetical protein
MNKTIEILYTILLICICILVLMYCRESLQSLYKKTINLLTFEKKVDVPVPSIDSTSNLFNTEYAVTEDAGDAISDALKDL